MSPLDELYIESQDLEQVWEQLQLQNLPMIKYLKDRVGKVLQKGDIAPRKQLEDDDDLDDLLGNADGDDEETEFDLDDLEGSEDDDEELGGNFEMDGLDSEEDQDDDEDAAEYDDDFEEDETPKKKRSRTLKEEEDMDEDEDEDVDIMEDDDEEGDGDDIRPTRAGRVTEVDDEFFSVEEMEKFAERGETRDMNRVEGQENPNDDWDLGLGKCCLCIYRRK
jgi:U3 small nucleolar RNA-associated protein MPP10